MIWQSVHNQQQISPFDYNNQSSIRFFFIM